VCSPLKPSEEGARAPGRPPTREIHAFLELGEAGFDVGQLVELGETRLQLVQLVR